MRRSLVAAVLLTASLLLVAAAPVAAFPLSTCSLSISSTDGQGAPLDTAVSGANDSTKADPFEVEYEGSVNYTGSTNVVIKDYTYAVNVFNIPTPIRGGDTNDDENIDGNGTVSVAANSPFKVTGLYFVSGAYSGAGGECGGSGWFKLNGNPVGTVPFFIGLALEAAGLLLLFAGTKGNGIAAVLGGGLVGLGTAVLLVIFSTLPLDENTPLASVIAGLGLGILVALLGRRRKRVERVDGEPTPA
jgi:MYXO-CTERM domain-containing protein